MNILTPSWSSVTRTYTQTTAQAPTTIARVHAAAFRVSHIVDQPVLRTSPSYRPGRDSVDISKDAYALVQSLGDVRHPAAVTSPLEAKTGIMVNITV